MAPERFEEMPYDGRADVYSLGVMLYRMLGDRVPFPAKELMAVAMQHLRETPPCLRELNPDVSAEVGTVVSQAMSKNMAERPAAAELMKRFGRAMRRRATDSWLTPFSLSLVSHILGAGCPVPVLIELGLDNGQRAREAILR
jgi:serine/threonine-protein kinase